MNNLISFKKVSKFFFKKNKIKALSNINLNFKIGKILHRKINGLTDSHIEDEV